MMVVKRFEYLLLLGVMFPSLASNSKALGCPFCSAIGNTISEDLANSDTVVIAEWMDTAANRAALARGVPAEVRDDEDRPLRDFQVLRTLKGKSGLGSQSKRIQTTFRGRPEPDQVYLIFGFTDQTLVWGTARPLQRKSLNYLESLPGFPKSGPERLKYFVKYLDHPEPTLADDAYNEFARAPFAEVTAARPYLDRNSLLQRIADPSIDARRRRLYLTLLGVCGESADAAAILRVMEKLEAPKQMGLDAAIACYLSLTKTDGVSQIEERYLVKPSVEQKNVFDAIAAIRFHGEEEHVIPRERLCAALRRVLSNPQRADLVMPDLARWEDWSAAEQIAELFRSASGSNRSVRVPAARYLMACRTPAAQRLLAELEKLDPASVRGAKTFLPLPPPDTD